MQRDLVIHGCGGMREPVQHLQTVAILGIQNALAAEGDCHWLILGIVVDESQVHMIPVVLAVIFRADSAVGAQINVFLKGQKACLL